MKSTTTSKRTSSGLFDHPLLSQTFSSSSLSLPTIAEIKDQIYTDRDWLQTGIFDPQKHSVTTQLRESYVGESFILLSEEFILSIEQLCTDIKTVVELGAGIGWLSHWLHQYGVSMQASIDNKSWSEFPHKRYLDLVQQMDSITYTKQHPEVEMFILSWPQEDDTAAQIWRALRSGQYLLYIGEQQGGCTADNSFFAGIEDCEVHNSSTEHMKESFLSFDDFHDLPYLYQKR